MKKLALMSGIISLILFLFSFYEVQAFKGHGGPRSLDLCKKSIMKAPYQELNKEEIEGLWKMREEEKLARDVYKTLYEKWGLNIFDHIASSEQRHMEMVKLLLDKYHLADPIKDDSPGKFTNPHLKKLYKDLVETGLRSVTKALYVGATIEDLDIYDLEQELKKTDNQDIKIVYQNLMKGSRNHMRGFTSWLSKYKINYKPQYISSKEFKKIISSPLERGFLNAQGKYVLPQ